MALTLVEQSFMFRSRKPRTLFASTAVIAICLNNVRLSAIEMPRNLLLSDVPIHYRWYATFHVPLFCLPLL